MKQTATGPSRAKCARSNCLNLGVNSTFVGVSDEKAIQDRAQKSLEVLELD